MNLPKKLASVLNMDISSKHMKKQGILKLIVYIRSKQRQAPLLLEVVVAQAKRWSVKYLVPKA